MIREAFVEGNMKQESPTSLKPKTARQAKSKVKSILNIFFDIQEIVHKEFASAGQTVNSANCFGALWRLRENVRRLRPELW
jgi:hypothetical protein